MATVRQVNDTSIMTHYFSTRFEVEKYVGLGRETGWYYQVGTKPEEAMHGPFRLLGDMMDAAKNRLTAEVTSATEKGDDT